TNLEPTEEELKRGLEESFSQVKEKPIKIQVTHVPPHLTKIDLISAGLHVGSKVVREFIEEKQPNLAVCGHIHEARGVDWIKNTLIINPGRLSEGYVGIIEIKEDGKVEGKVINVL
ncbi:MAG: metallophosphoesterase family protein, partial [Candidatus Aenigmarchaeota archaeon]|nr:metallophosphoesterase family protein [Candidatus Aenigmarchaeota archaeon]